MSSSSTPAATPVIIVTGTSGHLGEAIIRVTRQPSSSPHQEISHIKFVGIDIYPSSNNNDFTTHVGSIADKSFIRSILEKYENDSNNTFVAGIINCAVLHKPHIKSHSMQQFIDTNITGTLTLLESFSEICCNSSSSKKFPFENRFFIQTSTTSTYGDSLVSKDKSTITWIDESVCPSPKNIYGVTKKSAEDICQLFAKQNKISNVFVLQASRFFPEEDDDELRAAAFGSDYHQQFIELLHRRVEIQDLVDVHLLAALKAMKKGKTETTNNNKINNQPSVPSTFKGYICSTPSPFSRKKDPQILQKLATRPASEILKEEFFPDLWPKLQNAYPETFGKDIPIGIIDRVYCSEAAQEELGWEPKYSFERVMKFLLEKSGEKEVLFDGNWKSELAAKIGVKGYHRTQEE